MPRDTKAIKRILDGLEAQGAKIVETKKGWQIMCPDGSIVGIHKTESDHRALRNTRSRIKRAGLDWPLD